MLSPSDIRPAVREVLQSTGNSLASYQILDRLPEGLRDLIIAERGMPGAGAGSRYTAASLVTDAVEGVLPSLDPPHRVYLEVNDLTFTVAGQTIRPGNNTVAFYRLPPQATSMPSELPPASHTDQTSAPSATTSTAWPTLDHLPNQSKPSTKPTYEPWYESANWVGWLVFFLVVCWPIAAYGLVKSSKTSKNIKLCSSIALLSFAGLLIAVFANADPNYYGSGVGQQEIAKEQEPVAEKADAKPSLEDGVYITKEGMPFAVNSEDLDKAVAYIRQKDEAALQELIDSGRASLWRSGVKVRIMGVKGFLANVIKVRPVGETEEYWTLNEAVDR